MIWKNIVYVIVTAVLSMMIMTACPRENIMSQEASPDYIQRAREKVGIGDYDGALAIFDAAVEADPGDAMARNSRGYVKQLMGDLDGAEADYTAAIAADPDMREAYYNLGCVKQRRSELHEAIAFFDKAIEKDPRYVDALYRRGIAKFDIESNESAMSDFQRVIIIAGEHDLVSKYSFLRMCVIKWKEGKMPEAVVDARLFSDRNPGKGWEDYLIKFAALSITDEQLLDIADNADDETSRAMYCEAYFYAGEYKLALGDRDTAGAYFRLCLLTGVDYFTEYYSAGYELKRMTE